MLVEEQLIHNSDTIDCCVTISSLKEKHTIFYNTQSNINSQHTTKNDK